MKRGCWLHQVYRVVYFKIYDRNQECGKKNKRTSNDSRVLLVILRMTLLDARCDGEMEAVYVSVRGEIGWC